MTLCNFVFLSSFWFGVIFIAVLVICCVAIFFEIPDDIRLPVLKIIMSQLLDIRIGFMDIRCEIMYNYLYENQDKLPVSGERKFYLRDELNLGPPLNVGLTNWEIFFLVMKLVGRLLLLCFVISLVCAAVCIIIGS